MAMSAGLGNLKLEYDANKNPAIFQQLCELKLEEVIHQARQPVSNCQHALKHSCFSCLSFAAVQLSWDLMVSCGKPCVSRLSLHNFEYAKCRQEALHATMQCTQGEAA